MIIENGRIVLNLENVQWWYFLIGAGIISIIYGYITHMHSMTQINEYNKEGSNIIGDASIVLLLFIRVLIGLPIRIIALSLGLLCFILIAIGKFQLKSNYMLDVATQWHWKPVDIYEIIDDL